MKIPDKFLRIAHRGASGPGLGPENTLAAFEMAVAIGTDAVECDVHATSDGALVVMHDKTVDRTTNGKGAIAQMGLDAIKRLDAGGWKGPKFAGEPVPTLREMLSAMRGRAISVIEMKAPGIAEAVVGDLVATDTIEHAVVFSFDGNAVREVQLLNRQIATALLVSGDPKKSPPPVVELVSRVDDLGAQAIAPHASLVTPEMIRAFHSEGLKVWVWTVNAPEEMKKLRDLGVDAIITDRIDLLNQIVRA